MHRLDLSGNREMVPCKSGESQRHQKNDDLSCTPGPRSPSAIEFIHYGARYGAEACE